MRNFITNVEVPTLLGIIAADAALDGFITSAIVLGVIAVARLYVNIITEDHV
jgi:hypothetical protein